MGVLKITGRDGDTETRWTPGGRSETKARRRFEDALDDSRSAFALMPGEVIHEHVKVFVPEAKEIIIVKRLCGG